MEHPGSMEKMVERKETETAVKNPLKTLYYIYYDDIDTSNTITALL